jgi:Uma2 family endonuclease
MPEPESEQRVVLSPCTWETYERILGEQADRSSPRFTYTEGSLEIMSPSLEHEELNEAVRTIIEVACEELDIDLRPVGSTTQRSSKLKQGAEPDCSFYFGDLTRDPEQVPPDLMVEVEITPSQAAPVAATRPSISLLRLGSRAAQAAPYSSQCHPCF